METETNRQKLFIIGLISGLFTILTTIGFACGFEFKEIQYGKKWNWFDWGAVFFGGLLINAIGLAVALSI